MLYDFIGCCFQSDYPLCGGDPDDSFAAMSSDTIFGVAGKYASQLDRTRFFLRGDSDSLFRFLGEYQGDISGKAGKERS